MNRDQFFAIKSTDISLHFRLVRKIRHSIPATSPTTKLNAKRQRDESTKPRGNIPSVDWHEVRRT